MPRHPRRRYADVVVHRQLLAAVAADAAAFPGGGPADGASAIGASAGLLPAVPPPLPGGEVAARAQVMNERHRTAKRAQKECADLYLLLLLHSKVRLLHGSQATIRKVVMMCCHERWLRPDVLPSCCKCVRVVL